MQDMALPVAGLEPGRGRTLSEAPWLFRRNTGLAGASWPAMMTLYAVPSMPYHRPVVQSIQDVHLQAYVARWRGLGLGRRGRRCSRMVLQVVLADPTGTD